jgi:hypothetical protein
MFAVVDGVISLSARADAAARPFADALRTRLFGLGRAMAYVTPPEVVGSAHDRPADLCWLLLHVLLEPYGDLDTADRRVTVSGDDVRIGRAATTSDGADHQRTGDQRPEVRRPGPPGRHGPEST